jgi:ribosome-associated protein
MDTEELRKRNFEKVLIYFTGKSSGPGGQKVNKVNTRVELRLNIRTTSLFSGREKETLLRKLKNRINSNGELIIESDKFRTQSSNRKDVTKKFYELVAEALTEPARRIASSPSSGSVEKRLDKKRQRSVIKNLRKKPGFGSE